VLIGNLLRWHQDCSYYDSPLHTAALAGCIVLPASDHPILNTRVPVTMIPNLLVTDDDPAFRGVLCEALARRGFHVTVACDGQEALETIAHTRVHLALVDVHMPRVTGLEVMRHLTTQPSAPPLVLMSAQWDDESRREAERMRAYTTLSKPFPLSRLRDVVCGALSELYGWQPTR